MNSSFQKYIFLPLILVFGCSSDTSILSKNQKSTTAMSTYELHKEYNRILNNCTATPKAKLDRTQRILRDTNCISNINLTTNELLERKEYKNALKLSLFGKKHFPYGPGISSSFNDARKADIVETRRLIELEELESPKELYASAQSRKNDAIKQLIEECKITSISQYRADEREFLNADCIETITFKVKGLLEQSNSPVALKLAQFGMKHYSFDGRIKNSFRDASKIYIAATKKMDKDTEINCKSISERIVFLRQVSPDLSMPLSRCKADKTKQAKKTTPPKSIDDYYKGLIDAPIPAITEKYEKEAHNDITKTLYYILEKNRQDNYKPILLAGVKSWEGLTFNSTSIEFPANTNGKGNKVDLNISAKTKYSISEKDICYNLKPYEIATKGNPTACSDREETTERKSWRSGGDMMTSEKSYIKQTITMLNLGTKDHKNLSGRNFNLLTPSSLIFSLRFSSNDRTLKQYYYLATGVNLMDISGFGNYNFYWKSTTSLNFNQPTVHFRSGHSTNLVLTETNLDAMNETNFKFWLKKVSIKDLKNVTKISLNFEPYLTYKVYGNKAPSYQMSRNNKWKKRVHAALKNIKSLSN